METLKTTAATSAGWKPAQTDSVFAHERPETPPFGEQGVVATTWEAKGWLKSLEAQNKFLFIFIPRNSCPYSSKRATIQFTAEKSQKDRFPIINWANQKGNCLFSEPVNLVLKRFDFYLRWTTSTTMMKMQVIWEQFWPHAYAPMGKSYFLSSSFHFLTH